MVACGSTRLVTVPSYGSAFTSARDPQGQRGHEACAMQSTRHEAADNYGGDLKTGGQAGCHLPHVGEIREALHDLEGGAAVQPGG